MNLTTKPRRKANETRELTKPIEAALNKLDGVRVARNNTGVLPDATGRPVTYGLGLGSADLVGICAVPVLAPTPRVGRVFCLEVKRPGNKPKPDQVRWLDAVRRLGGFATVVHSIDEAVAAIERCRAGESS